ncbi:Pseudouridine-metabolizing bifunctional protein, partial [Erysiphe neolycopersici]
MKFLSIIKPQHRNRIYQRLYQRLVQSRRFSLNALNRDLVTVSEDVVFHKNQLNPVVALESALYTHILPYPENFELALRLQDVIRRSGATPATIGIINSVAKIGLSDQEIHSLCSAAGKPETLKVSRNDLSFILGMGIAGSPSNGGTTISSTMTLARWAGINVLATSGFGDVHLGGKDPLSMSADLTELGRTPIAIISGGFKSSLDTHRTLELLEAKGILVATYSDARVTNINFPEYYSHDSRISSPRVFHDPKEAAAIIFSLAKLGTRGNRFSRSGALFANPISEDVSIPKEEIEKATHQATSEATKLGIHGKEAANFVLNKIKDFTNGRSDSVSRASIESNVILASKIAIEVASLWKKDRDLQNYNQGSSIATEKPEQLQGNQACKNSIRPRITKYTARSNSLYEAKINAFKTIKVLGINEIPKFSPNIAIIGAVANKQICDFILSPNAAFDTNLQPILKSTNHSRIEHTVGGVGHDIALATHLVSGNQRVRLYSLVANDLPGSTIVNSLKAETLDVNGIKVLPETIYRSGQAIQNRTAQCVHINDGKKDLVLGMNDFQIFRHNSYEFSKIKTSYLKWA